MIKQKVVETSKVVETCPRPPTPTPAPEAEKRECKPKKRKVKCEFDIVAKTALKKKKKEMWGKKARLLCNLKTNDLHMKHINPNVCKNK